MTSVTSPQQTDRRGTDEIPGQRGGQGVRLLVLGTDGSSQELRDRATAAGYELAQRYSARVSHVAYGTGIDPEDARYAKIRDAGLILLPLQKCAEALGLVAGEVTGAASAETEMESVGAAAGTVDAAADVVDGAVVEDVVTRDVVTDAVIEPASVVEAVAVVESEVESAVEFEAQVDHVEPEAVEELEALVDLVDDEPLEIPPLHHVDELVDDLAVEPVEPAEIPLAAAVIGADPWLGESDAEDDEGDEAREEIPVISVTTGRPAIQARTEIRTETRTRRPGRDRNRDAAADAAEPRSGAGHVLFSLVWALIPFATFGLLTPVAFGYAAYRLRSRALALSSLLYTIAVVLSFVLSAARPHAAAPSNATGALLTVALAGTWIGGTLHGLSIRNRVFAR